MITTNPTPIPLIEDDADSTSEVLHKIQEGFQILAELHSTLARAPGDSAMALEHVTAATRELAAIQRLFDRRTDR